MRRTGLNTAVHYKGQCRWYNRSFGFISQVNIWLYIVIVHYFIFSILHTLWSIRLVIVMLVVMTTKNTKWAWLQLQEESDKRLTLLLTTARGTTEAHYALPSCDCILARVQSFQMVHRYTPNRIMGKTMATTECRSVTGAIKERATIQEERQLHDNTHTNTWDKGTDGGTCSTTNNLYSTG